MLKILGVIAVASAVASPCAATQADIYGAMTMAQLAKVLTDVRGIPTEVKNAGGTDIVLVDAQAYQSSGHIQITGLLCDGSTPPVCRGLAVLEPINAPASAVSDAQLLALQHGFDFINVHRVDADRLAVTMPIILDGGVTAQNMDSGLGFFAGQYNLVKTEVTKLLPATTPPKGKGH